MLKILLVGGVWSTDILGNRASGYIRKFGDELNRVVGVECRVINGGWYKDLCGSGGYVWDRPSLVPVIIDDYDVVLWFVDVSNSEDKLLSRYVKANPGVMFVQSKNNRVGKYSNRELRSRMVSSGAPLLVEFKGEGEVSVCLHSVYGEVGATITRIDEVVSNLLLLVDNFYSLVMPVSVGDDWEVPIGNHKGSFGYRRKHHRHEGVDIYVGEGEDVRAMESGVVVGVGRFTGEGVGSPWWNETGYVMVEGGVGVILYGEISVGDGIEVGKEVGVGDVLGRVVSVLKEDKGNGVSMLHLEWYMLGVTVPVKEWGGKRPVVLLDPTILLGMANRG